MTPRLSSQMADEGRKVKEIPRNAGRMGQCRDLFTAVRQDRHDGEER